MSNKPPSRALKISGILATAAIALGAWLWMRYAGGGLGRLPDGLSPSDVNLVIVTLDTTRADRLGCYGYQKIATPRLDQLAKGGTLFEQAHSPVPLTLPSHSSMFTGKYPPAHGVRDNGGYFLPESEETLAETLREAGFATGGFVSAYVLDHRWGIAQGFDKYVDDFDVLKRGAVSMGDIQRRGDVTLASALGWLKGQRGHRFFAWIHFYDPHSPYDPPEPFATTYAGQPYTGEIAFVDSLAGQLLDGLSEMGLRDRTLVVVTADHGESLGEHNESGHAFFVYGVSTHVPLIVAGPWPGLAGHRVPDVVRTVDIMPTVLELLGIRRAHQGQGVSLVPLLAGDGLREPLSAYAESWYPRNHFGWSDLMALRDARYRFIEAPRPELYDVAADPAETANLAGAKPQIVDLMRERLRDLQAAMGPPAGDATGTAAPMDEETQKKLAALGYIGATVDTSGRRSADLPDPKDKIAIVNRMHQAREAQLAGDLKTSITELQRVIADAPEVIDAYFRLGNAYMQDRRFGEALEMYRKTLALKPDHAWAAVSMADVFNEQGRIEEAILGYRQFLRQDAANDNITYRLAETLMDAGRLDESAAMFRKVLEIRPDRAAAAVGLGAVALRRNDTPTARAEINRALAIDPNVRNAHYDLALALESENDWRGAAAEYRREIELHPHAYKARFNLSRLLGRTGDKAGEIRELKAALEDDADLVMARFFLAKALLDAGDLSGAEAAARKALEQAPDSFYAPLAHYVLADIYTSQGRSADAASEVRLGRKLEARNLPPPPG